MIDFTKRVKTKSLTKAINPIDIYSSLDRASESGPLRPVQYNVLNKWYSDLRENKDLVVKLHTGAGKTLIGLLMAMSYINAGEGPAVYVCPNIYLMQQACKDAQKFGIPFCYINSDNNEIPNDFVSGKSILITYVQKVFNGLSIFGIGNRSMNVGCIVLDDSHACIDSMIGSCTIHIVKDSPAYSAIFDLIKGDLKEQGNGTLQDLISNRSDTIMAIPYWTWQNRIDEITTIISKEIEDKRVKFAWPLLRDQLIDCHAFISSNQIEISPPCLPIRQYGIFNNASHRILMSATTQEDTFFIKGLGLSIAAVKKPLIDEDYSWSGEKMILIPELICPQNDESELLKKVIGTSHDFGIAVLTPSFEKAKKYEKLGAMLVNVPGSAQRMYQTLQNYRVDHKNKTIVLANRYDGIDLPDDTCRILILDSVPYYDSLSDRYEELCRTDSEIVRIKTIQKIEQGLGRSVRGEKDFCVILIVGKDLIKYIRSIQNQRLFSAQTQKQIEIGFDIIEMAKEDLAPSSKEDEFRNLFSTMKQCLERDEGWKIYYSSIMDEIESTSVEKEHLYLMLQKEKEAYDYVTIRNYEAAARVFQSIVDGIADNSEKGWYLQEKAKVLYRVSHDAANSNQISAFKKNNQLLKPQSGVTYGKIKYPINITRNQSIIEQIKSYGSYDELSVQLEDILTNMSFGIEAEKAERAFHRIGQMLGYVSQRPDKEIRKGPDVLWCITSGKYVMFECKTEVLPSRTAISKSEAGQMEEHCAWFEAEYSQDSMIPIQVIPIPKLADDAYFSRKVRILAANNLEKLKKRIREFFMEFRGYTFDDIDAELVQKKLEAHGLQSDEFFYQFTELPYR